MQVQASPQAAAPKDEPKEELLSYADAVARIKRSRGKRLRLMVRLDAPTVADPGRKVFPLTGIVRVTKSELLRFLEDTYSVRFSKEALVRVHEYENSLFVG